MCVICGGYDVGFDGVFGFKFCLLVVLFIVVLFVEVNVLFVCFCVVVDLLSGLGVEVVFCVDFIYVMGSVKILLFDIVNVVFVGCVWYLDFGFFEGDGMF